jgi:hypothetical protein
MHGGECADALRFQGDKKQSQRRAAPLTLLK